MPAPELVVLDVNEALSNLEALRERFTAGASTVLHRAWSASADSADDRGMRSLRS